MLTIKQAYDGTKFNLVIGHCSAAVRVQLLVAQYKHDSRSRHRVLYCWRCPYTNSLRKDQRIWLHVANARDEDTFDFSIWIGRFQENEEEHVGHPA